MEIIADRNLQESPGDVMEKNKLSVEEIKKTIEERIRYPYLEKFIERPIIDERKLFLLNEIFHDSSYSVSQKKSFILTSMLVQIALDTHDKVSLDESAEDSDRKKKIRQLTVLAGDYYSGLYYYLLSQLEDIQMIKVLASAIKEINELKMSIYYKQFSSLEDFMQELQPVESLLVCRVAEYMGKHSIRQFAENFLLQDKLMRERESFFKNHHSSLFHLITKGPALFLSQSEAIKGIEAKIEELSEQSSYQAGKLADRFPALRHCMEENSLEAFFQTNSKVVEEG